VPFSAQFAGRGRHYQPCSLGGSSDAASGYLFRRPIRRARSTLSTLFARGQQRCGLGLPLSALNSPRINFSVVVVVVAAPWCGTCVIDGPARRTLSSLRPTLSAQRRPFVTRPRDALRTIAIGVSVCMSVRPIAYLKTSRNTWMICRPRWGGATPITFQGDL